jgi:MFS family permease
MFDLSFIAGSLFLFSSWYTKKELAKRISVLYAAGQLSGAFGGLLGSAIMGGMEGKAGLAAWRWLCKFPVILVTPQILIHFSHNRGHCDHSDCFRSRFRSARLS